MSFSDSLTSSGDLGAGRVTEPSSVDLASVEYIASYACIAEAWKKVRANKGAPGVDNINITVFPDWARPQWKRIHQQLLDGTYQPLPALRVEIPKETGGMRLLGIPCVPTATDTFRGVRFSKPPDRPRPTISRATSGRSHWIWRSSSTRSTTTS